jgi:hypothetical protein
VIAYFGTLTLWCGSSVVQIYSSTELQWCEIARTPPPQKKIIGFPFLFGDLISHYWVITIEYYRSYAQQKKHLDIPCACYLIPISKLMWFVKALSYVGIRFGSVSLLFLHAKTYLQKNLHKWKQNGELSSSAFKNAFIYARNKVRIHWIMDMELCTISKVRWC